MSKKRVQLLRNYVYGTNLIDKINNGRLLVEEYGFKPKTFNKRRYKLWLKKRGITIKGGLVA